ncbi:hypothetical protein BDF19DRAFT_471617 [Syncephalis fuscata]|nr:hypothetical protein BDF19DRAFT_471617 [Syncephalis fuscata]
MDDLHRLNDSDAAVSDEEETVELLEKGHTDSESDIDLKEDKMEQDNEEDEEEEEDNKYNAVSSDIEQDIDNIQLDQLVESTKTTKRKEKNIVKGLTSEELDRYKEAHEKSGLIYLSRIPPFMKPQKIRHLLSQYGKVGRIYLAPEDENARKRRRRMGGNRKLMFTEGWVEFSDKKVAKLVAKSLNAQPIGNGSQKRGFYQHDLWNLKYLPKFKWNHLTERIAYERAARQQRMQTELEQARRENKMYMENVERGQLLETIHPNMKRVHRSFRQKEVVASEVNTNNSNNKNTKTKTSSTVTPQVASVLAKLFRFLF